MDIITYNKTRKIEDVLNYVGQEEKFPKNLNAIPYVDRTGWGMTFNVNDDNSVTCDGNPTNGNAYLWSGIYDQNKRFLLKPGTYTLSGGKSSNAYVYLMFFDEQTGDTETSQRVFSYGSSASFSISTECYCSTNIYIAKNTDVDGYTFYPQIEEGWSATAYEDPFITFPSRIKIIEDLDIGKVKSKNLNTLPYYDNADHTHLLLVSCRQVADKFSLTRYLASHEVFETLHLLVELFVAHACDASNEVEVFVGREVVDEEGFVDIGSCPVFPILGLRHIDVAGLTVGRSHHADCTCVGFDEVEDETEQGALASSVVTNETKNLSAVDFVTIYIYGDLNIFFFAKGFLQVVDDDIHRDNMA